MILVAATARAAVALRRASDQDSEIRVKVAYLAAGASHMLCGSCLRDNRLVSTLIAQGRNVTLVPLYTPLRTDEADAPAGPLFYGGVSVYLEQKSALFQRMPRLVARLLNAPALLARVARLAARTRPEDLGALTVSVLRGQHGRQRRELDELVRGLKTIRPDVVNLPDLMFLGVARRLRDALRVPIVCTLSGEDLFLDGLPEPYRSQALDLIRQQARDVDAYIAVTRYYARHCAAAFGLPMDRIRYVPLGIHAADARPAEPPSSPFAIGYLARICPAKGLLNLAKALAQLRGEGRDVRLHAAGTLSPADQSYLDSVRDFLRRRGCEHAFEYRGEVTRREKFDMLARLHAFSVPSIYHEAKGLTVLEALAAGVPVVQPRHGSFPELVEDTGGGLLYDPADDESLAASLRRLMDDDALRRDHGARGREAVLRHHTDERMARETWNVYEQLFTRRSATDGG